jgi:hypothetical protein
VHVDKVKQGKKNRKSGSAFELRVRKNLESEGWIVIKNPNNVIDNEFTQGKSKYNPFTKRLMMNSGGFPDFIIYAKRLKSIEHDKIIDRGYKIVGIEVKSNGYLDKIEREICSWILQNNVFSEILIAKKGKKRGEILYDRFKD